MFIRNLLFFVIVAVVVSACGAKGELRFVSVSAAAAAGSETYTLGETPVRIKVTRFGNGSTTFVALHRNESTSVAAAKAVLSRYGGKLVELIHIGGRNIAFTVAGKRYEVDPNRIFTPHGIRAALGKTAYSEEAHRALDGLAAAILRQLNGRLVVALHNNSEGSYSILQYRSGGRLAGDAAAVHIVPDQDSDDFFFVTGRATYSLIKDAGFNVALQSGAVSDDGSLSVYMARRGVAYVNIEAQHGHLAMQTKMLEALLMP